jgi:hypothetical protein
MQHLEPMWGSLTRAGSCSSRLFPAHRHRREKPRSCSQRAIGQRSRPFPCPRFTQMQAAGTVLALSPEEEHSRSTSCPVLGASSASSQRSCGSAPRPWLTQSGQMCRSLPDDTTPIANVPELNPDELVWNHLKRSMATSIPKDITQLHRQLYNPLRRLRRSQYLLRSCINASVGNLKKELPGIKVIGMGLAPAQSDIMECVQVGADGFILKGR